jgi:type I restriction-modification system DNA methylase subunit
MAILIRAYTNKDGSTKFGDILGDIYMACGFGSSAQGQFFTPFSVCQAMAQMQGIPKKNKIISVMDCAVGGGALPIAYAEHLYKNGINYQMNMLLHATDISINSVCMCMIQCSILGIPAIITHGNALTNEVWEVWETPTVGIHLVKERLKYLDVQKSIVQ